MVATVAIAGLLILFALAAVIGLVDSGSQHSAWNRIAMARREIFEGRRAIDEYLTALQLREDDLDRRERAVRARELAVEVRERRLGPPDTGTPPAA